MKLDGWSRARSAFRLGSALLVLFALCVRAQEKITYEDHVFTIVEANCAKCHNSDKKKGDLDLTSFTSLLAGGASGKIVAPADPDASKLWKVVNHLEEPTMPPNRGKLPDKDLAVIRKWIAGGLLENAGSKAASGARPTMDLSLSATLTGKPDGPPPMPGKLPVQSVVQTERPGTVTSVASSPWAPVLAATGQKQITLFHEDSLILLGVLPFGDAGQLFQPGDVKFSRNGKLVIVAGGHAGRAGRVAIFELLTGKRMAMVGAGQEFDSVLAADLSPDQACIAAGGPSRIVRLYSTSDGALRNKLKKHTDWVTAIAFSPNGDYLATADRNGGLCIWDAEAATEIHKLAGHKSAVTCLTWRSDSKVLASASEDGSVKVWEMTEGKQVKSWPAHPAGALSVHYSQDGRLITCGRDNQVVLWSGDGARQKQFTFTNDLPTRAVFSYDGMRVFAGDNNGGLTVWQASNSTAITSFVAHPMTNTTPGLAVRR